MKPWTVIAALALFAGCMNAPEEPFEAANVEEPASAGADAPPSADAAAEPPPPITIEGTIWLPPSSGQDRAESLVEVPVAANGSRIHAALHLGSRYGATELPPLLTDVLVELRDPTGEVLGSTTLTMNAPDGEIEAVAPTAGTPTLAILSYGGSDGQANGDHVDYVVNVVPE